MYLECYKKDLENLIKVVSILERIEKAPKLFIFTENGIVHSQMYNGGAYMINFAISKTDFLEYTFEENTPFKVEIEDFNKVLSKIGDGESIKIEMRETEMIIKCSSQSVNKTYTMKLQEVDESDIDEQFEIIKKVTQLPFDINLKFHPEGIKNLLEDVVKVSKDNNWITFGINSQTDTLFFKSEIDATVHTHIEVDLNEYTKFDGFENEIDKELESETTIDAKVLYDILSLDKVGDNSSLKMHYSADSPIRILIRRGNMKLGFLAAPADISGDVEEE